MHVLKRILLEIHRRSIWQVPAMFLAGGWAVLQAIDTLIQQDLLPDWVFRAGVGMLLLALPLVLIASFARKGVRPRSRGAFTVGVLVVFIGIAITGRVVVRALDLHMPETLLARGVIEAGAPVLLADFESPADPELGAVVTRTLRIDLLRSRMIRVPERRALAAALTRMQRPDTARISAAVAKELAEREGYGAVVAGDVAQIGTSYVLTASILAGDGFEPVAAFRETARGEEDLVDAIERLSHAIRDRIGESLRTVRAGPSLAHVTTTSLAALRAYTRGAELDGAGDTRAALEQYERAVAIDTTFAMAYRKIGAMLNNQRGQGTEVRRFVRRAYELRDRLPELERQLAIGAFHERISGDIDAAFAAYAHALEIDSIDATARNNLANLLLYKGRFAEAAQLYAEPLRERPIAALWWNLARSRHRMGDFAGAIASVDSAMTALTSWMNAYYVQGELAASRGDFAAADSMLELFDVRARTPVERDNVRLLRYLLAAVRGRLREAERILDQPGAELFMANPLNVAKGRSAVLLVRGDTAAAIRVMRDALAEHRELADAVDFNAAIRILAAAGAARHAAGALDSVEARWSADELGVNGRIEREVAVGRTARVRGDVRTAAAVLEALQARCSGCRSHVAYEIARAREDMGDADGAIAWYRRSIEQPDPDRIHNTIEVPRALQRLAELYDARGDVEQAAAYYVRFIELWRNADPELQPQVRAARARLEALLAGPR